MKFKFDENLGRRGREILATAGHDVSTVADQRIEAIADSELLDRCQAEKLCLITLDLGFANPAYLFAESLCWNCRALGNTPFRHDPIFHLN